MYAVLLLLDGGERRHDLQITFQPPPIIPWTLFRRVWRMMTGEPGSVPPCKDYCYQWSQGTRQMGNGYHLVVTPVRVGISVSRQSTLKRK